MTAYFGQNLILLEKLASGGMGEVFRARQLGTGGFQKTVAVKRILPQYAMRNDFATMFEQEMKLCARLQHQNIVQVFSNGREGGYLYLVMEFVNGRTVAELLIEARKRKVRIPPEVSCFIAAEVAHGLSYAHGLRDEVTGSPLGIVHRDVSPQNIMIGFQGEVKIVDFGIAKIAGVVEASRSGDIKGKVPYAAPEYIEAGSLDSRSDVFALGVVLHELLAQRPLFVADSTYRTLRNVVEMVIPSLVEEFPDIKFELEGIVSHALERDPEQRFQSADDLARAISIFTNKAYSNFTRSDFAKFVTTIFGNESDQDVASLRELHGYAKKVPAAFVQAATEMVAAPQQPLKLPTMIERLFEVASPSLLGVVGVTALIAISTLFLVLNHSPSVERVAAVRPIEIAGVVGWYNPRGEILGSGTGVREWTDGSWLKNSLKQLDDNRRPQVVPSAIAGYSAIRFDGSDDFLSGEGVASIIAHANSATVIVVARALESSVETPQYTWSFQASLGKFDRALFGFSPPAKGRLKFISDPEAVIVPDGTPLSINSWGVYTVTFSSEGGQLYNGSKLVQELNAPEKLLFSEIDMFSLGQASVRGAPARFFHGDIAELAIYSRILDGDEMKRIVDGLGEKYGIQTR